MSFFMKYAIGVRMTDSRCWEVTSHKADEFGYPQMKREGKAIRIHRVVYENEYGPLAPGQVVRHTCDNRLCVNPKHLIAGTHEDNVADRVARGRCARGVSNGRAKLTEEAVRFIRNSSASSYALASYYGVDLTTLIAARTRKTWAHVE